MESIEYKGYRINAYPQQLAETDKWTISIIVEAHHGSHTNTRNFSASNVLVSREEAVKHCFEFGRRIIDGKTELSAADL